jgi:CDI immunity proteins
MTTDTISIADILGPWIEPDWDSGLIARCREAWSKPLRDLSREELATLLRQRFAVEHLLPVARQKLQEADDDTEMFEGELAEAIECASRAA